LANTALKEGLRRARGDIVAFFDADLQYDPKDLVKMIDLIGMESTSSTETEITTDMAPLEQRSRSSTIDLFRRSSECRSRTQTAGIKLFSRRAADRVPSSIMGFPS